MRDYELTCIGDINAIQENIISQIQKENGALKDTLKKVNTITFYFQMEPQNLANFEKRIKSEKGILRYMILAKPFSSSSRNSSYLTRRNEKIKQKKVEIEKIEQKIEELLG
jgi:hypothetical protein